MKDYTEVMQLLFPEDFSASSYSIVEGIHAEWGLYVFAVSVVLSIFAGFILSKKAQPLDV